MPYLRVLEDLSQQNLIWTNVLKAAFLDFGSHRIRMMAGLPYPI
jgi:hypothetical protein